MPLSKLKNAAASGHVLQHLYEAPQSKDLVQRSILLGEPAS